MLFRLSLPRELYDAMVQHAQEVLPHECCGLLAGRVEDGVGRAERLYRLVNALASPVRYASEAHSLLDACRDVRTRELRELVIYHSHPTCRPIPSRHDLEGNHWGEYAIHVIVGLMTDPPEVAAWWLTEDGYRPAEWDLDAAPA